MKFTSPLLSGHFIKRYKRFFADVQLDHGEIITAHCPNTGAMAGLLNEGCRAYVSPASNPDRKLKYTLEIMEENRTLVGVNTQHPNQLAEEAILLKHVPELDAYESIKREVRYGTNSRIDLLLSGEKLPDCYVEVKNVHNKKGNTAFFPDAVTTRGQKHVTELMKVKDEGHRAVMFFVIQRDDVDHFDFADFIDPDYARLAREAIQYGVECIAYTFIPTPEGITLSRRINLSSHPHPIRDW